MSEPIYNKDIYADGNAPTETTIKEMTRRIAEITKSIDFYFGNHSQSGDEYEVYATKLSDNPIGKISITSPTTEFSFAIEDMLFGHFHKNNKLKEIKSTLKKLL